MDKARNEQHKVHKRYVEAGSVFMLLAASIICIINVNVQRCELVKLHSTDDR